MKFNNVLLASDFDGTLKNDAGIITDDVKTSIKYFMDNGGFFTVCTGRIFQGFHLYSPEYINAPVLLGNGAMAMITKLTKSSLMMPLVMKGLNAFMIFLMNSPKYALSFIILIKFVQSI